MWKVFSDHCIEPTRRGENEFYVLVAVSMGILKCIVYGSW